MPANPHASGLAIPANATPLPANTVTQISLYMRRNPRNEAAWQRAVAAADNGSFLSGAEIAKLCAADRGDVRKALDFAKRNGLTVKEAAVDDRHVILEGTVADIEKALGLQPNGLGLHEYDVDGVRQVAHTNEAPVPAELAGLVEGTIVRRPDHQKSHLRTLLPRSSLRTVGAESHTAGPAVALATPSSAKLGSEWAKFYGCVDGKGAPLRADNAQAGTQRSSVIISYGGGHTAADVNANCATMGLPNQTVNELDLFGATNAYTGDPQSADLENILDIATKLGMAPGAKLTIAYIPNDNVSSARAKQQFAQTDEFDELSESWGDIKANYTAAELKANDDALQALAVAGKAYFNSCGDSGDRNSKKSPTQTYPAASPFATGVGGTEEPGPTPANARVWNDLKKGGGATGCDVDPGYPAQPYMAGFHGGGYTGQGRGYAEISMDAAPGTGINVTLGVGVNGSTQGQVITVGGTSLACPMAGGVWLLGLQAACDATGNQKLRLGQPGPIIFGALAGTPAVQLVTQGATEDWQAPNPAKGENYGPPTGVGTLSGAGVAKALAAYAVAKQGKGLAA